MLLGSRGKPSRFHMIRFLFQRNLSPTRVVILGFLALILLGAALLMLPCATRPGQETSWLCALFTSTSATCVTGLVVVDTYTHWSPFGQAVILVLIQCGGIGFMSLAAIFSFLLRRTITLRERLIMTQSMNINDLAGVVRLTRHVLVGTFFCEFFGAVILSIRFSGEFGWRGGIIKGVFHAVSAFCNAGFDLMGEREAFSSLTEYAGDPIVNITIMALIVIGGLGFFVWEDMYHKRRFHEYTLHTKLVLTITAVLLIGGSALFFFFEYANPQTLGALPPHAKVFGAMFQATTTRTAGFNTIDQTALTLPSKMLSMLLMFIGGSSGSTAGGIKTVTFGILVLTAVSVLRGKSEVTAFGRKINPRAILNALALAMTGLALILISTLVITLIQPLDVVDVMYETVSAIATVGLATGATAMFCPVALGIMIALMFFGRVGILTISLGLLMRGHTKSKIRFPEGKVLIG